MCVTIFVIDMGHFGKGPIRVAWIFVVLPSIAMNYLGQGTTTS